MDVQDIELLYETYGPMVIRRCRSLLGNEDEAADAAQEVFVRLLERADSLDLRGPSSLLYRMATNHCLNRIRASSRRPVVQNSDLLVQIASLDDDGDRVEMRSVLDRIFRRKKESTRLIAVLHWVEGMTLEEVADEVGMSVSGVRKRLRQLKSRLGPMGDELDEV
jgi:RNA polymerase sigma-70 factor (ECF subfamily)